jgi:TPR repeat protein
MKLRSVLFLLLAAFNSLPCFAQDADIAVLQDKAAKGDAMAEYQLGRAYHLGKGVPKDFKKAADLYRQAAAQGNAKSMYNLGYIYLHGQGVEKSVPTAKDWFQKSADAGLAAGELQMGLFYYFGENGITQDYPQAAKWFTLAAKQVDVPEESAPAANALGALYEHGFGVPMDGKQALFWYTQAAETGYARAESNLGRFYSEGLLIKKDPLQCYIWLKLAVDQADILATHLLPEFINGKEFSPEVIAEGDRKVKEFETKLFQAKEKKLHDAAMANLAAQAKTNVMSEPITNSAVVPNTNAMTAPATNTSSPIAPGH